MIGIFVTISFVLSVAASASVPAPQNATTAKFYVPFDPTIHPDDVSCDPLGHIFLLLPDFSDCNKFYMCTHGEEVQFSCAGGTVFDFHRQTCDWPWSANCTLRTPLDQFEGSGDEINDNLIGVFADALEKDAVDITASVRPISLLLNRYYGTLNCNRADDAARQLPYKGDCQRYWKCIGGIPQVLYCSDGLFFNEGTQQCDFEGNSKCNSVLPQDELQSEFIVYKK